MKRRYYLFPLILYLFTEVITLCATPSGGTVEESFLVSRFSGEAVVKALAKAYPRRIAGADFRKNDWALKVGDVWFYWAGGRLLPEELLGREDEFSAYPFYRYPSELPPLVQPDETAASGLRARIASREANPPRRYPGFFNALWRIQDRETSWQRMKTTYFLGYKLEIHRELLEDLAAVEEEIQNLSRTDSEVRRFITTLAGFDAYNWRAIAGTGSMSFHAYGAAVDLLPKSYDGRQAYWRWASTNFTDWFIIPYEKRYHPPRAFIQAFENHGFVWGGKWFYFDTIHFEYRPEIFILNSADSL